MPSPLEKPYTLPQSGALALVADLRSRLAVIVTHPWGPLGGNLHNNVVSAVVLYFQRLGITTMRFNFCGSQIGRGYRQWAQVQEAANFLLQGKHIDNAMTTTTEAVAAAETAETVVDDESEDKDDIYNSNPSVAPTHILLVGYSYGALIGGSASVTIPQCIAIILIALPVSVQHWLVLFAYEHMRRMRQQRPNLPRLLIMGSRDNFTSEEVFAQTVAETFPKHSTTGAVLMGADHFFGRREKDLTDIMGQWLRTTFPECLGDLRRLAHQTEWNEYQPYSPGTSPRIETDNSTTTAPYCGILQFPMASKSGQK